VHYNFNLNYFYYICFKQDNDGKRKF